MEDDSYYMRLALEEAEKCSQSGDVPVGAVIVQNGEILAISHNQKEKNKHTCDHAEILCITSANEKIGNDRLDGAVIYTTKEPCLMCMGAILSARISKIVFGVFDNRFGTRQFAGLYNFNHKCEIIGGVLEEECSKILSEFFKKLR